MLSHIIHVMQVPPPSLGTDMAQLLESGTAADVKFKVEGEDLPAHKFILTARSPVFRSAQGCSCLPLSVASLGGCRSSNECNCTPWYFPCIACVGKSYRLLLRMCYVLLISQCSAVHQCNSIGTVIKSI